MLTHLARGFISLGLTAMLATSLGCRQLDTNDPEAGRTGNLCADYSSCDECIAGQVARGFKKGAAETQCGAAVTGCWTTWKKPVVCSSAHVDDPQLEEAKAKAAAEAESAPDSTQTPPQDVVSPDASVDDPAMQPEPVAETPVEEAPEEPADEE